MAQLTMHGCIKLGPHHAWPSLYKVIRVRLAGSLTCSLSLGSSKRLMDHDPGVGQGVPLPLHHNTDP